MEADGEETPRAGSGSRTPSAPQLLSSPPGDATPRKANEATAPPPERLASVSPKRKQPVDDSAASFRTPLPQQPYGTPNTKMSIMTPLSAAALEMDADEDSEIARMERLAHRNRHPPPCLSSSSFPLQPPLLSVLTWSCVLLSQPRKLLLYFCYFFSSLSSSRFLSTSSSSSSSSLFPLISSFSSTSTISSVYFFTPLLLIFLTPFSFSTTISSSLVSSLFLILLIFFHLLPSPCPTPHPSSAFCIPPNPTFSISPAINHVLLPLLLVLFYPQPYLYHVLFIFKSPTPPP